MKLEAAQCVLVKTLRPLSGRRELVLRSCGMNERIGFIGLGIMGSGMAANIAKAGYALTVYNRTPKDVPKLASLGVRTAPGARVLAASSDVTIAMVTGPEAIEDLLWGTHGVAEALEGKVFINMSTISARVTREIAGKLANIGVSFIDAPVSGSKKPAEDATLLILASGDSDLVKKYTPLLLTMGKKVVYCGEAGRGTNMKLMNNLLLACLMEGFSEALNFGRQAGLSVDSMLQVILAGPLASPLFETKAKMMLEDDFPPNFPLKHMVKDLKFVVDAAYEEGIPVPTSNVLLHLYGSGAAREWGDLDVAAILKVLQHMNREK